MKPKLNDVVQLLEEYAGELLPLGAVGVVVAEFGEPEEAYEIEFSDSNGETIAQIALKPNQFKVLN